MNLNYIKDNKCPKCGCNLIIEESIEPDGFYHDRYREHCSGGRWERRKFSCGTVLAYFPNGSMTEIKGTCTLSKEYKEEIEKKEQFKKDLDAFIDSYNVDFKYKNTAKTHIYIG